MRLLPLLFVGFLLSGCAAFDEPDWNKPLIPIPPRQEAKPKEEKVWIEAKTSRAWVNPHVDENGDLVEGHYKHIITEAGHWAVQVR